MGALNLVETEAIAELAEKLYSFLPASFANYTWREVARENTVEYLWAGGKGGLSKTPAIVQLLEGTLANHRDRFCGVVLSGIKGGLKYRRKNKSYCQILWTAC